MLDFEKTRTNMVDCQIRPSDITSHELLAALLEVPREKFVPDNRAELAYIDEDLPLVEGRYLCEPAPFAKMVQACGIGSEDVVLDIGCASGYSSAVLSKMASLVIAIEEDAHLASVATQKLSDLDYDNVVVIESKLSEGYESEGPYDVIFIGGAIDKVPQKLFDQIKDGGKLIAVEGYGNAAQARLYMRIGDDVSGRSLFNCALKPLPGFEVKPEFAL